MNSNTIEEGFQRVWQMFQQVREESRRETEEVRKLLAEGFREVDQKIKELSESSLETKRIIQELSRAADKRALEADKRALEADRRDRERALEADKRREEIDKQLAEMSKQKQETDKQFTKLFGRMREYERNWGKLVEALVKPSVAHQFRKRGIDVVGSGQQMEKEMGEETIEIDILLSNGDALIAVEVKTTLSIEDVDDHIKKHLEPFKRFFPEYQDRKIYGAVAYIHVVEEADRYAYKKGLFVLTFTTGDAVAIKNDKKFVPQAW